MVTDNVETNLHQGRIKNKKRSSKSVVEKDYEFIPIFSPKPIMFGEISFVSRKSIPSVEGSKGEIISVFDTENDGSTDSVPPGNLTDDTNISSQSVTTIMTHETIQRYSQSR